MRAAARADHACGVVVALIAGKASFAAGELPAAVLADLECILAKRSSDAGPLTIVFATADFTPLMNNWLAHAARAGETSPLVVALDDGLGETVMRPGISALRHRAVGSAADLWTQRVLFFEYLARRQVDFMHSDVDAVWLSDPRPLCFADSGLDLVFSQGTDYPAEIWRRWGFVLCCGLFAARGSEAVADFFAAVRAATLRVGDDQVAVNHLLANGNLAWDMGQQEGYQLPVRDRTFKAWRRMLKGSSATLNLQVGLLPHHLVPRLPEASPDAWVRHPLGPGSPPEKAALLRKLGCWQAD